jgi:predicted ester cyclase
MLDMACEIGGMVIRFNFIGTYQGEFFGTCKGGKCFLHRDLILQGFENGKGAEDWDYFDIPTVVSQIPRNENA